MQRSTTRRRSSGCSQHGVVIGEGPEWHGRAPPDAEWVTGCGRNPSNYGPDGEWQAEWLAPAVEAPMLHPVAHAQVSSLQPVEQVSWLDCARWLPRAGLVLPSEAQWEHGARAGTESPFSSGPGKSLLQGFANVFDVYAASHGGTEHDGRPTEFDDGSTMHAPVGSYLANGFGLHDVHGNVYEWCVDGYHFDSYERSADRDPVVPWVGDERRVFRGGCYRVGAGLARSSVRHYYPPGMAAHALGVRPAAVVE